jgi:FkbM family methyltransferase
VDNSLIKSSASCVLARMPKLYRALLETVGRRNTEKLAYLQLVKSGWTVFDVGANTGYYTILFSHLVGSKGHVHAFEPVPPTFNALSERLAVEGIFSNVRSNSKAVCDVDGQSVELVLPGDDHGQASLAIHASGSWKAKARTPFTVQSITLDKYAEANDVRGIDFLKIDVEGAELLVLRGARRILSRHRPLILLEFFEDWTRDFQYGAPDIIDLLVEMGYRFFYLDDFTVLQNPIQQLRTIGRSVNVICSPVKLC